MDVITFATWAQDLCVKQKRCDIRQNYKVRIKSIRKLYNYYVIDIYNAGDAGDGNNLIKC